MMIRGEAGDAAAEKTFVLQVMQEVKEKANISDEQLAEVADAEVVEGGKMNWPSVGIVKAVDRFVPAGGFGSGAGIAMATHDVYVYLTNSAWPDE